MNAKPEITQTGIDTVRVLRFECLHAITIMMLLFVASWVPVVVTFVATFWGQSCSAWQLRGPALVETKPLLLDSYIPASMQIIAHITELMKYDMKPTPPGGGGTTTTSTTTPRPTRPHKPGVFAPESPPGPRAFYQNRPLSYAEYVERLTRPSGYDYHFHPYQFSVGAQSGDLGGYLGSNSNRYHVEVPQDLEQLVGKGPSDILKLINSNEDDDDDEQVFESRNPEEQVLEFARLYDDSDVKNLLLKAKKVPPTKAYVGLLSLYDLLNKESKKLGLNKYTGYSQSVLDKLVETSTGTSADQLKTVLTNISKRKDTKNAQILRRIGGFIKDLEDDSSYLNVALKQIPPLVFAH